MLLKDVLVVKPVHGLVDLAGTVSIREVAFYMTQQKVSSVVLYGENRKQIGSVNEEITTACLADHEMDYDVRRAEDVMVKIEDMLLVEQHMDVDECKSRMGDKYRWAYVINEREIIIGAVTMRDFETAEATEKTPA